MPEQSKAVTDGQSDLLPAQPSRLMESCGGDCSWQGQGQWLPPATGAAVEAAAMGSGSSYSRWLPPINLGSFNCPLGLAAVSCSHSKPTPWPLQHQHWQRGTRRAVRASWFKCKPTPLPLPGATGTWPEPSGQGRLGLSEFPARCLLSIPPPGDPEGF